MLAPFYDEQLVQVGENKLTLAVDFRAIDLIENTVGQAGEIVPMPEVVQMLFTDPLPLSVAGKVLRALLVRHHPEVTLDETAGLMFSDEGNKVGGAMIDLLLRSMNLGKPKKKAKGENPPKPRGVSEPS